MRASNNDDIRVSLRGGLNGTPLYFVVNYVEHGTSVYPVLAGEGLHTSIASGMERANILSIIKRKTAAGFWHYKRFGFAKVTPVYPTRNGVYGTDTKPKTLADLTQRKFMLAVWSFLATHCPNCLYIARRYPGLAVIFPALVIAKNIPAVPVVFHSTHVLQIVWPVVLLITVLVINRIVGRRLPMKGKGYDSMAQPSLAFPVSVKFHPKIAIPILLLLHNSTVPNPSHRVGSLNASYVAETANLIKALISWHVSPFFAHFNLQNKTPLQIARSYHATGDAEVLVSKYSLFGFSDNNPSRDKGNYTKNERGNQQ